MLYYSRLALPPQPRLDTHRCHTKIIELFLAGKIFLLCLQQRIQSPQICTYYTSKEWKTRLVLWEGEGQLTAINWDSLNWCPPCTEIFSKRRKIYSFCVDKGWEVCPTWQYTPPPPPLNLVKNLVALCVYKLPESNPGGLVRYLFAIFSASITRISSANTTRNPYIMIVQSQQQATVADGISSFHRNTVYVNCLY